MEKNTRIESPHELARKIRKLKLVHYISVEMNKPHSTKELLDMILQRCVELTEASGGTVMLIDKKENVLEIIAYKGITAEAAKATRLKVGEGVTGWVALSGMPKLVNNKRQDPMYVSIKRELNSELAVPIKTENELIGVISMDSVHESAFDEDALEMLGMVAELAAQIIMRGMSREKLESKINSQEALLAAFDIIEKEESLSVIFARVMETLGDKTGILRGMLVLFDAGEPGSLKIKAGYKLAEENMKKGMYKPGEGIIGGAVKDGKTIAVEDIEKEPRFLNKMKIKRADKGKVSFIASPIKIDNRVIGVLAAEKLFEGKMQFEDSVNTLTLLSSMLAYKVKNHEQREQETGDLRTENIELKKELKKEYSITNIIGKNEELRKTLEQVKTAAGTLAPVLITGETGTGKELIAKALHLLSERSRGKLVSVNCAAIPENLLESELFGYVKGAFTGAASDKKGRFELADGGTLFLDEIGDMPLNLQPKILRALQAKEIEPVGSEKTIKVDIRIIAATNMDLKEMVKLGKFRQDLYYRLNVMNISLPPLRDRRDDIPLLANFFIKKFNTQYDKNITGINDEALEMLTAWKWPGNIRELENALERAVILSEGKIITAAAIPQQITAKPDTADDKERDEWIKRELKKASAGEIYKKVIGAAEKKLLESALEKNANNKVRTAEELGINRNTLKAKMREYGIKGI